MNPVDIALRLTGTLIPCWGGRTGTKLHLAHETSSRTQCGHWLRYAAGSYRATGTSFMPARLCEKCFPQEAAQ